MNQSKCMKKKFKCTLWAELDDVKKDDRIQRETNQTHLPIIFLIKVFTWFGSSWSRQSRAGLKCSVIFTVGLFCLFK